MPSKAKMSWFRMHSEFVDDPKVQRLAPDLFKFWVNCLGLACQNGGYLPSVSDICWKLKLTESKVGACIAKLNELKLLDIEGETFTPHNWAVRQYKSDVSTDRVRRFRNGNETFPKQDETVSGTAPETEQNRAEQKQIPKHSADAEFEGELEQIACNLHSRHPPHRTCSLTTVTKKLRTIAKQVPKSERIGKLRQIDVNHTAACVSYEWTKEDGKFVKSLEYWLAPTLGRFEVVPASIPHTLPPEPRRLTF